DLPEREVPRHHREHGAERVVADVAAAAVGLDGLGGEELLGVVGVEVAGPGALLDLGAGLPDRLTHLLGHDAAVVSGTLAEQRAHAAHLLSALGERGGTPGAERVRGTLDRALHV